MLDKEAPELERQPAQDTGIQLGVVARAAVTSRRRQRLLKYGVVHTEHRVPVHLDQPAVAVPREPLPTSQGESLNDVVDQSYVEDRLHHAGHRQAGTGADGDEERGGGVAQPVSCTPLQPGDFGGHLVAQSRGGVAGSEVLPAGRRANDEPLGDRKPQTGHLAEVGALPAEQVGHPGVAVVQREHQGGRSTWVSG